MEKQKKKNQDTLVKSVAMIVAVLAFIGGFALSSELKERIYRSNNKSKEVNDDVVSAGSGFGFKTLGFDNKLVDSDNDYNLILGTYAGNSDSYFTLQYGESLNEIKLIRYFYDSDDTQEFLLQFNQDVIDTHLASFADNPTLNSVLFLLENGDVAYGLVDDLASDLPTYTTIDDLSNVVKFYHAINCNIENECNETTLAQSTDKNIVDLYKYIVK